MSEKKKTAAKTSTTKVAPKKARKVAVKDLSEKEMKETTGGEFIPFSSRQQE